MFNRINTVLTAILTQFMLLIITQGFPISVSILYDRSRFFWAGEGGWMGGTGFWRAKIHLIIAELMTDFYTWGNFGDKQPLCYI